MQLEVIFTQLYYQSNIKNVKFEFSHYGTKYYFILNEKYSLQITTNCSKIYTPTALLDKLATEEVKIQELKITKLA